MPAPDALRSAARAALLGLLIAAVTGCGTTQETATASAGSRGTATAAPTSTPTGTPAPLSCPEATSSGIYDYFEDTAGEPWEKVIARFTRQSVQEQHPDAVPTVTAESEDGVVVTFVDRDGRGVARVSLQRMSAGWRPLVHEVCTTMAPAAAPRHY